MDWLSALILGILQGLTEFLPVSSSGHLEIGKAILGLEATQSLAFTVAVHGATVMSIIIVFYKDILTLIRDFFRFEWNDSTKFLVKIFISMIPVILVGLFLKEEVESFYTGNVKFVGFMLLITGFILLLSSVLKTGAKNIPFLHALVIGISQAIAVLPGISRSGATIATGLILKNQKDTVTRFSFLMVILPILGANLLDAARGDMTSEASTGIFPIIIGAVAAFVFGTIACRWMISIVRKGKLFYFAIYCFVIGSAALILG